MKLLRHPVAGLIIFAVLVGLCVSIYSDLETAYSLVKTDTEDGLSIMEKLDGLLIIQGINSVTSGVYDLVAPTGSQFDILGALASVGVGVLKLVGGLLTFPFEILTIVMLFYHIPMIVVTGVNIIIISYVAFILLSAFLRSEV
jgi:hypothetical protein